MDPVVASRQLTGYCELVAQAQKLPTLSRDRRAVMKTVNERVATVNQILRAIVPDIKLISAHWLGDHVRALPRVYRALALLRGWGEMASHEWIGDGPALPLSVLDPVVANAAVPLFEAGKYRQAVADAATSVNQFTQNQLDRHDVSDKDLMAQAFSGDPPKPGKPRMRCPGDHRSMTIRSVQQGALLMAQGCFQAIRNPATHMTGDWNPVTAAEHLAVLSVVARWVRYWDVVEYVPPPPDYSAIIAAHQVQAVKPVAKATE
jgi:Protein of unknown function (Hypoth_ymh)